MLAWLFAAVGVVLAGVTLLISGDCFARSRDPLDATPDGLRKAMDDPDRTHHRDDRKDNLS